MLRRIALTVSERLREINSAISEQLVGAASGRSMPPARSSRAHDAPARSSRVHDSPARSSRVHDVPARALHAASERHAPPDLRAGLERVAQSTLDCTLDGIGVDDVEVVVPDGLRR